MQPTFANSAAHPRKRHSQGMTESNHPFLTLKARVVMVFFFALALGVGVLLVLLGSFNLLPLDADDALLPPLVYILVFSGLCLALLAVARRPPLRLVYLLGPLPPNFAWVQLVWLVGGIFLFSLGTFQVSYLALSWVAPGWVEGTLQQSLLLSADQTAYPRLYHGLMLISVVVVAPITEEFIFRGILLHRWAVKWGVRPAIVLTSVLFGLLHSNLLGLFVFGIVMSLLYLSTRSLLVPIVAHALNNALASGLEFLTVRSAPEMTVTTLAEFRETWWLGVACLLVSAPWVLRYIVYRWPKAQAELPYFANQQARSAGLHGLRP